MAEFIDASEPLGERIGRIEDKPMTADDADVAAEKGVEHSNVTAAVFGGNGANGEDELEEKHVGGFSADPETAQKQLAESLVRAMGKLEEIPSETMRKAGKLTSATAGLMELLVK